MTSEQDMRRPKDRCVKNTTHPGKIAMLFIGGPLDGTWKYIQEGKLHHAVDILEPRPAGVWEGPMPGPHITPYKRVVYVQSVLFSPHHDERWQMHFMRPDTMSDAEAMWLMFRHYSVKKTDVSKRIWDPQDLDMPDDQEGS